MSPSAQELFANLLKVMERPAALGYALERVDWDRKTQAPPKSLAADAKMMAVLTSAAHEAFVDGGVERAISEAMDARHDLSETERLHVERLELAFRRASCIPATLVHRRGLVQAEAMEAWGRARDAKRFAILAPFLGTVIDVVRDEAACLGADMGDRDSIYTTTMGRYEPGMSSARLFGILETMRTEMLPFIAQVRDSMPTQIGLFTAPGMYPEQKQMVLARKLAAMVGYDLEAGHLCLTRHPFESTVGPHDTRITTRVFDDDFRGCVFGVIHESGHAMFEQGRPEWMWMASASDSIYSLGVHESQSRLWECQVGRSRAFIEAVKPLMVEHLPGLFGFNSDDIYRFINQVRRHYKRVEADELQYFLHILMRIEIERALLSGQLSVTDLPDAFAAKMESYLGVTPNDDVEGVLQDVHWSMGAFGYFGTYANGSFAAAQEFNAYELVEPMYQAAWRQRDFSGLLNWLRPHHQVGLNVTLDEFLRRSTGEELNPQYWMQYAKKKYGALAGIEVTV